MIFAGLARLAFFVFVVYALLVVVISFLQRKLQYFPSSDMGDPKIPELLGMKPATIKTEDGLDLVSWFAPPKEQDGKIIVYFHGNAGNISNRDTKAAFYIQRGYGILLCGYRGYGLNPGTPTEEGLYKDARANIKWLSAQGYSMAQLVLYGESLGSGVAVQMAGEFQPKQVVLEAPFSSAAHVAKKAYFWLPVDSIMKDRYDNLEKIPHVKADILIVHGDRDEVVPIALGKRLFEAANHPKQFITIERGQHNDLYDLQAGAPIAEWLARKPEEKQA